MECVGSRNLGVYRVLKGDYRFVELYRKKLSALMKGTWTKLFPILLNSECLYTSISVLLHFLLTKLIFSLSFLMSSEE